MTTHKTLLIAVVATLAQQAHAQQPAPSSTAPEATLPAVVVRGEKIARDIKDTTTSVGVVDDDRIQSTGVRSLPDAFRLLGNVRDADFLDSGILIRGINSEGVGGPAGRPLASVYIDGVAQTDQGVRRGALGLWDVEQVEVLRGPQSTISGRNALAGAIRLQTKDPSFDWESAAQLRVGEREQRGVAAVVSGPLSETLAFRVAGEYAHQRGFVDYPDYGGLPRLDERRDDDYRQVRGKLLWQPAGARGLRVLLGHADAYDSPSYDDVDGPSAGVDWFDRKWGAQSLPVFVEARSSRNASSSLDVSAPLGTDWRLTSLTTRVRSKTDRSSVDNASVGLITQTEVAQELRLNYDAGAVQAVVGAYLNREKFQDDRDQVRPFQPTVLRRDRRSGDVDNEALFGEVNLTTGRLTWVAGARYDREEQSSSSLAQRLNTTSGAVTSSTSSATAANYDAFLPKLGARFAIDATQSVGLTLQRGYRAGGAAVNAVTGQTYTYEPEYADNIELAYRFFAADRRLRVNANLFAMRWKNQQVNVPQIPGDFTSDLIVNAGRSRVTGGELELQWRASTAVELFSSIGVARTEFRNFEFVQFGAPLNLNGESFPQAPEFSAAIGGQWKRGGWFVGGDAKYTGKALSRSVFEGLPADRMPAYTVINTRAGYEWAQARVSLYIDNALDESYFLYRFDDPSFQVGTVGKGRQAGIEVYARF
jgi:outer membrane receptor protein involved in Fe transport